MHRHSTFWPILTRFLSSRSVPAPGRGAGRDADRRLARGRGEEDSGAEGEAALGAGGEEDPAHLQRRAERGLLVRPEQRGQAHRRALRGLCGATHVWDGWVERGEQRVSGLRRSALSRSLIVNTSLCPTKTAPSYLLHLNLRFLKNNNLKAMTFQSGLYCTVASLIFVNVGYHVGPTTSEFSPTHPRLCYLYSFLFLIQKYVFVWVFCEHFFIVNTFFNEV